MVALLVIAIERVRAPLRPARRSTSGSGCRRSGSRGPRFASCCSSPASSGPALLVGSFAWRYGLGLDAPWYLLELVGVGYVKLAGFAIALAGTAAACQLAAGAAGRYAPYPDASERGPRGPFRELVRSVAVGVRSRRRVGSGDATG